MSRRSYRQSTKPLASTRPEGTHFIFLVSVIIMKVVQIAGFLGSGKTTTIIAISQRLSSDLKKKVAVIVNEIGKVPVDARVVSEYGLKVMEVGGGCICCEVASSMAYTLKELSEGFKPEIVIIEPTGVALPRQVKEAVELGAQLAPVEIGRTPVLFEPMRGEELLDHEELREFVMRQLRDADIIAVNKTDAVSADMVGYCVAKLREMVPHAPVIRTSAATGEGISAMIEMLIR